MIFKIVTITVLLLHVLSVESGLINPLDENEYEDDEFRFEDEEEDLGKMSSGSISEEMQPDFWNNQAQATLAEKVANSAGTGSAKNVILFIGDGMSQSTVTAARTLLGQRNGLSGEEARLSFENFATVGLAKTYCLNKQVAEGACSATAIMSGIKSNARTLGVSGVVQYKDVVAAQEQGNQVATLAQMFQKQRKRTGFVTTTRVTYATPASLYAKTPNRAWENDLAVLLAGYRPEEVQDIASQLITSEAGKNLDVVLGGGRAQFIPIWQRDSEGRRGRRVDGKNLIEQWQQSKAGNNNKRQYVSDRDGLLSIKDNVQKVLGLFSSSHMPFNVDRDATKVPSLSEMTQAAIKVLKKGKKGFLLVVEAGRIDHGHHISNAQRALDETIELSKAVEIATQEINQADTLIVVTSDHSQTLSFNGNAQRGNNVLGIAGRGSDGLPYATLSYSNGPGYKRALFGRYNIQNDDLSASNYQYPALVPRRFSSHAADDVTVYAQGPSSEVFSGANEQNYIAHAISYAACVGQGLIVCG